MTRTGSARIYHPAEVKNAILEAFDAKADWKTTALILNVNIKTCRSWIQNKYLKKPKGKHGGGRRKALTDLQVDSIMEWVAEQPTITLEGIRSRLKDVFDLKVDTSTVARSVDGRVITVKKQLGSEECENTLENEQRRKAYVLELLTFESEGRQLVWIDEMQLKLFGSRSVCDYSSGYSKIYGRGLNLYILVALTKAGLLGFSLIQGGFFVEVRANWLRELLEDNVRMLIDGCVLICGNSSLHSALDVVLEEERYREGRQVRLSPYCPTLNPVEGVWSIIRTRVSETMRLQRSEILSGDPTFVMSKSEWRMRILEEAVNEAKSHLTPDYCRQM
ncbi:unnamed protein product, partial [Dicrocoelium dendriticum]